MSDLIDRVAEAMAGWPMDTAPAGYDVEFVGADNLLALFGGAS